MSINLNQNVTQFYSVQGLHVPCEGPRAIPLSLDFTLTAEYDLNLQNVQARNFVSEIQAIYVDNSANLATLNINAPNTGQVIAILPGEQGYVNILTPNPVIMSFTCTGTTLALAGKAKVYLLNYPVTNAIWSGASIPASGSSTASGGVIIPNFVANYTLTGDTQTTALLLSPAVGYYVAGFAVFLTSNSTLTAGTDLQVSLTDSVTGAIGTVNLSPANGLYGASLGFQWNNKTVASTLTLTLSTALSVGELYYTIPYGVTTFIG